MLNDLLILAQAGAPDKRHQLAAHVTDLFVRGADRYQIEEITLFNTVLESMLPKIGDEQKKSISEQLAPIDSTSHQVALALAKEEIDIARPMLTSSNALKTEDILRLAKTMRQGHLLAIAKRSHLETNVTDVLLERGEDPVKQSVSANSGAKISNWGRRLLVKLAAADNSVRNAMMERSDITEADYEQLIDQMPMQQRTQIRKLRDQNEEIVQDLFHKAGKAVTGSKLERRATRINAEATLKEIRSGRRTLGKAITQLALSNNLVDICFLLSEMVGFEQKYVTNVMVRYDAIGIAVLCRAMAFDDNDYLALSRARATHNKQPATTADKWLDDFKALTGRDARRLLSFMKIRLNTLEAQTT